MSTNYINKISDYGQSSTTTYDIAEGVDTRIFRATCSTAAATAAKVATLDDSTNYTLAAGVRVAVTFTYGNSAATPTLNVNSGGAKTIVTPTAVATLTSGNGTTYNTWGPYETVIFTYNGTYWVKGGTGYSTYNAYALANSKTSNTGTVTSIATTSPISGGTITTSGTISHANSGVTAGTYGTTATTALTPGFGGTFSVPGITVNATGHVTAAGSHTVKIPTTLATTSSAGLMSSSDKSKIDNIRLYLHSEMDAADSSVTVGNVWLSSDTNRGLNIYDGRHSAAFLCNGSSGAGLSSNSFKFGTGWDRYTESINNCVFSIDSSGNIVTSGNMTFGDDVTTEALVSDTDLTVTLGSLMGVQLTRWGRVVQLTVRARNTSSVASGGNIFSATLKDSSLHPLQAASAGGFYGAHATNATINTSGVITIRNSSSTAVSFGSSTSNYTTLSFTYIIA